MKISIVLPDLRLGGVEKMRIVLAREWIKKGHDVEFVLLKARGPLLQDAQNLGTVINLDKSKIRDALNPLISYLKTSKPQVLLVGMWPLTVLGVIAAKLSGSSAKIIVSEHIALSRTPEVASIVGRMMYAVTAGVFYRIAQKVVAVSKGVSTEITKFARIPQSKVVVIPNPAYIDVPVHVLQEKTFYSQESVRLLAVGTLKPQKDYDTLLKAIKKISTRAKVSLSIVGDGPDRGQIEGLINKYDIGDIVVVHGSQECCHDFYFNSDIFILSSQYEGFGNVIVEALSYGLYVISTRCPHGPSEILCDGKYGSMVNVGDVDGLAESIFNAIKSRACNDGAIEYAKNYSPDNIASAYESLFVESIRLN